MAKRIRIIPWLDRDELDKQLNKIGKEKRKINIDVNGDGADDMVHKLHAMNSTGAKSTSIFGKMKNVISDTFSSGKLAMTGYLAVLRGIDTAADKAKDSIKELNKAETDLMIATDMSRESVRGLMKDYNSYAKELSSTTQNISDAANDYLRAGKTLEESQALIKDSIMLSKLGDIESATATEDLLATMNGYEMSIEEVDRALDAMVAIDMKAATSAGDLSTGLKYSASSAHSAGLSFNKLIAILGTVQDKTMMSAETVGTFANTMLSRYRDITIGKYLADDGDDISNYESVLKSCGLELRNSQGEFRTFEDVLGEMTGKWDSLTSVQQNALIKVAAGTRQQNRFIALMEGYNKVLELTEVAATSAGTAVDKFNSSYMTSLEAKENTLQASFESMIYNSDLEEVYGDILNATTALVNFINQTNALKGVMTGLAVSGGIKAFLTIKTGIHDAYINLNQFQNALNMVKQTNISSADFDRLLLLTNNLSESQMRLIMSTDALSITQKEDLLVARGLSREKAKLKLQTYGVTQAQTGLTASTTSAKTAMQGFISVLKANPLFVIATAISAVSMAVSTYKNHLEEVRQATAESANAYKESTSSIDDYISRYQDLQKALQDAKGNEEQTASVKQQLLDLQTELNSKFGEEAKAINLVTGEYEKQIEAIRALNKEEANKFLNVNRKGISTATAKMEKEQDYVLSAPTLSVDTPDGKALQEIVDSYTDEGMRLISDDATGAVQIVLKADAQTAYETLNNFETDLRNKAKDLGNEKLFDSVFEVSSGALNNAKSVVDKYGEIYNQALMAELVTDDDLSATYNEALNAVEAYNEALVTGKNVEEAKKNLDDVKAKIEGNSETWGKYASITEDLFAQAGADISNYADTVTDTMGKVEESTKFTKTQMIDTINSMADGFDVLDDIYADVLDGDTFDFTKLDTSKFSEAFSEITPEYEKFIETVSSSPTDIDACQGAFNDLVSAFIDSKGILSGLTEENKDLTISMLQNMGVANAEDIVMAQLAMQTEALSLQKQFATEKGYELTEATYEEINGFLATVPASDEARFALAQLAIAKIDCNNASIDSSSDIENLLAIAKTAGFTSEQLLKLESIKSRWQHQMDIGNTGGAELLESQYRKTLSEVQSDIANFNPVVNVKSKVTPKYSGGKSTADAIEKANKSASDSAKDAAEKAKDEYNKFYDFMEIRNERLNDSFELLEKGIENVVGAFAKNNLIDAQLGNIEESINNNTDALAMYKKQAENVLSTIDNPELRDKIVNGAVELTDIQGENADVVKSAIEAYQNWSGKIQDCQIKLAELQKELENLELAKFTNIVDDFNDIFDLREDGKDLIEKQIDLIRESGNFVGKSYYQTLIEQSGKQLVLLEEEKAKLVKQINESLSSGRVQVGSEAWVSMLDHIQEVEESILDVKTNIEELDTELLNLHYEVFEKVQENFDNIGSELDNLADLFDDELEIKVSDGNGNWTDEALGQLGLLAQNLELSKYRVTEYGKEIEKLSQDYLDGKYTLLEYQQKLAELSQEQWNCVESVESLEDAIIDLNQTRIDEEIETIEDEIDAYEKLIDSKLKALDAEKDLHDYRKSIAEQSKSISDLEKQRAALENDNSQVATAKKKLLDAQIADEKSKLEEMEYKHSIEEFQKSLEQQLQDYTDARNAEIEALRLSLENRELLISQSFENVKANASTVGEQIALIAQEHGIVASNAIISPWTQGENAIASYGEVLSVQSSAFIGNIMGVENEVYNLQNEANVASVALSNMFATRADNLVGQLQASWYAEDNLNYATGILQQSLVNTLERGYNIGGITSALGGIQSGLNGVADAANRATKALQEMMQQQDDANNTTVQTFISHRNAPSTGMANNKHVMAAFAKGGIIKKDNNPLTPIAKSLGEDTVIVGKEGERVLTQKQNDLFETMVKNLEKNGNNFQWNIPNLVVPNNIPLLEKVNRPNVTINYDSMLHVDNFTDAPHLIGAIKKTSKEVTEGVLKDIDRRYKYYHR